MHNGYRFIDSDAHVLEPADMFEKYLEPKFRSRMPVAWSDYKGEPLAFGFKLVIPASTGGEYVMPFGRDPMDAEGFARNGGISFDAGMRVALPGHDEAYAEFARDGFAPAAYSRATECPALQGVDRPHHRSGAHHRNRRGVLPLPQDPRKTKKPNFVGEHDIRSTAGDE